MRYPKECVLKDCREALIRKLAIGDEKLLAQFYEKIPAEDRWYMRYDATHPRVFNRWFEGLGNGFVESIVALCESGVRCDPACGPHPDRGAAGVRGPG